MASRIKISAVLSTDPNLGVGVLRFPELGDVTIDQVSTLLLMSTDMYTPPPKKNLHPQGIKSMIF
jgi:hypothetical protein